MNDVIPDDDQVGDGGYWAKAVPYLSQVLDPKLGGDACGEGRLVPGRVAPSALGGGDVCDVLKTGDSRSRGQWGSAKAGAVAQGGSDHQLSAKLCPQELEPNY
jgi:hypothetical protein